MNIAVFCGSAMGSDPLLKETAAILGRWIGKNGHTLIYGGGEAGLMGVVAQAAFEAGSRVIGVLPGNVDFIRSRPQTWCSEVIVAEDMAQRKKKMMELADVIMALPGGIGTLDEMSEAITLTRIGLQSKPCIFLNAGGFYEPIRELLQKMVEVGFIEQEVFTYTFFDSPDKYRRELEAFEQASADPAVEGIASGSCGPKAFWLLEKDGTLQISGEGAVDSYDTYLLEEFFSTEGKVAPWQEYAEDITAIKVGEGITALGSCAFYGCENARQVFLPDSLLQLGWYAFAGCASLERITIPSGVTRIETCAFEACNALEEVVLPQALRLIGETAFTITDFSRASSMVTLHYPGNREMWREVIVEEGNDIKLVFDDSKKDNETVEKR